MKQPSMSKVHSDIILSIPICISVSFPPLHPKWASTNTASIFVSILLLCIFTTIFAVRVYVMMLIEPWSLHFVAFSFSFKAITVTQMKSFGHSAVSYMSITCCWSVVLWIWDNLLPIIWVHPPVSHHLLQPSYPSFSRYLFPPNCARLKVLSGLVCIYFLFGLDFQVSLRLAWS